MKDQTKFWTFNIGHLLTIISMLAIGGSFLFSISAEVNVHSTDINSIKNEVREIQKEGTIPTRLLSHNLSTMRNEVALARDELSAIKSEVARLNVNIEWLKSHPAK